MFDQLLSVFLESPCEFCDRVVSRRNNYPQDALRDRNVPDRLCEYCFARLLSDRLTQSDRQKLFQDLSIFAWGKYDGQIKRAIALMKYSRQPEISKILGTLLGTSVVR